MKDILRVRSPWLSSLDDCSDSDAGPVQSIATLEVSHLVVYPHVALHTVALLLIQLRWVIHSTHAGQSVSIRLHLKMTRSQGSSRKLIG